MNHLSTKAFITARSRLGNTGHAGFHEEHGRCPSQVADYIRFQRWHHSVSSNSVANAVQMAPWPLLL